MNFQTRRVFRVDRDEYYLGRHINIRVAEIITTDGVQTVAVAGPITLHKIDPAAVEPAIAPTIRITHEEAQQFMDELYRSGIRPTEVGSMGQLAATERHLEDMRKLVFVKEPA